MPKNLILSPSGIGMYNQCQYSFYLRYILKKKPIIEDDSALKLGKSVHAVLEHFYGYIDKNSSLSTEENLTNALKKSASEFWMRDINAKKREEMNNSLFIWLKFEIQRYQSYKEKGILEKFFPQSTEEDIIDYQNKLRAIIDKRCLGQSGNMYCIDYKTDKSLPAQRNFKGDLSQIDDKYKVQSALNAMVLKSKGVKLDNFYFQFIRNAPDKLLSVPLTLQLFSEVETLIQKIRNTTVFEKNPKGCFFCNMKIYCKMENTCNACIDGNIL